MNLPQPISQVLLRIEKALQDELITDSGIRFYVDPTYRKEWQASVTATITALPIKVPKQFKHIIDNLSIGDEVAISYRVVADFEFQSDGERFMQTTEDNPLYREYMNSKGHWVKVYALPGIIGKIWVGVYQDRNGNVISGVEGSESEMERWLAQFQLGKTDLYTFRNHFSYNGNDYWKCDIDDVFAKKVKGKWVATGDRVICKPVEEKVPDRVLIAQHRGQDVRLRYQDRGRVMTGGKNKRIKKDDIVGFNPRYLEKYEFGSKQFFLINENLVNGKWQGI